MPNDGGCGFKITGQGSGHGPEGKQKVFCLELRSLQFPKGSNDFNIQSVLG